MLCERVAPAIAEQIISKLHHPTQATAALSLRAPYLKLFAPVIVAYAIDTHLVAGPLALALWLSLPGTATVREGRTPQPRAPRHRRHLGQRLRHRRTRSARVADDTRSD